MITMQKKGAVCMSGAAFGLLIGWLYLPKLSFSVLFAAFGAIGLLKYVARQKSTQLQRKTQEEFSLFLDCFTANMAAGKNVLNAISDSKEETRLTEGTEGPVVAALDRFALSVRQGIGIGEALNGIAEEITDQTVSCFFQGLSFALGRGANMMKLAETYHVILQEQRDLEKERALHLAGMRREQRLLFFMPIVLITAMRLFGIQGDSLSLLDVAVRLFCLLLFWTAWRWSASIIGNGSSAAANELGRA
ncbi:MAG: hypothetical protein SOR89_02455 [Ndongobacter sp.]|nr:hypothetical protein [Ndongobacter sp.]